jgi:hypothetical protein
VPLDRHNLMRRYCRVDDCSDKDKVNMSRTRGQVVFGEARICPKKAGDNLTFPNWSLKSKVYTVMLCYGGFKMGIYITNVQALLRIGIPISLRQKERRCSLISCTRSPLPHQESLRVSQVVQMRRPRRTSQHRTSFSNPRVPKVAVGSPQ